jgi:mannobiose 2-epimerase
MASRTMNTLLHVLEGYTGLYRIWPDDEVRQCLYAIFDILEKYIWNPEKKQFEYVETFSNLPDIELDTENETISVAYRADYSYYVKQTYKWVGKSLVLITDDSETVEDMETEE